MTIKVIFSECSLQFWVDVAADLMERATWEPCYWIADAKLERLVKDNFPEAVFHSTLDAVRGIPPSRCIDLDIAAVDATLLRDLSPYEPIVLKMMDRMDPGDSFTYQERVRLYHRQLAYWLGVLRRFEPEIVVFPQVPHLVYDYILYGLCQCIGIKTIMFERTRLPGLIFPLARFEAGSQAIAARYSEYKDEFSIGNNEPIELSRETEDYLNTMTGNDYASALPFDTKEKSDQLNRKAPSEKFVRIMRKLRDWRRIPSYSGKIIGKKWGLTGTAAPPNYLKQKEKSIENSHMSGLEWRQYKEEASRRKHQLERYYNSVAHPVDLQSPYVYVTLNFQPERTSSPLAGIYVHSFLMVELLSKTIPNGWQLYVKDHPFQLSALGHGERSRTRGFYEDLISLDNVKLVPLSTSSFALIDNAMAVATQGFGTSGWEAVVRGKPALVFGYPWYLGCEGVFDAQTEESCREAFATIVAGYRVDQEKVRLFVNVLEQVCFRGYVDPVQARAFGISHEENVLAITQALLKACERPSEAAPSYPHDGAH